MHPALPLRALFYARAGHSRLAELEAVAARFGVSVPWCWDARLRATNGGDLGPRLIQPLPALKDAEARALAEAASQCVGCRGVFELWGQGESLEACAQQAARLQAAHLRGRVVGTWRLESVVLGARRGVDLAAQRTRREAFASVLDALADQPVDLSAPRHRIWLVEDRQSDRLHQALSEPGPRFQLLYQLPEERPPIRTRTAQLDLAKRAFLSTSTLPADQALLLCNLALARAPRQGASLLDPFCGSGGILLAAAALGAHTVGSDLDWRVVSDNPWPIRIPPSPGRPQRGTERVRMRDNFVEAELPEPKALLTLDVNAAEAVPRLLQANGGERFDALVCDPPYGRREFQGGEKAWDGAQSFQVDAASLEGTLGTLLRLAAELLSPQGTLAFLIPVRSPKAPKKPEPKVLVERLQTMGGPLGLELRHLGVQVLHRGLHRAVVVMDRGRQ